MAALIAPMITGSTSYPTGLRIEWAEGVGTGLEVDWSNGVSGFIVSVSYRMQIIYTVAIYDANARSCMVGSSYLTNGESYMVFVQACGSGANPGDSVQSTGTVTYSYDPSIPTCPPPETGPNFLLREIDDNGDTADYVDDDSAVFVTDSPSWNFPLVDFSYHKAGELPTTIELDAAYEKDEDDYQWECLTTGYYRGWYQLTLKNLSPGTTYYWTATTYDSTHTNASEAITGEFTTTGGVQTTQLARPSINAYPRATGDTRYTTLQIRLTKTIDHATSYEYQIALDSDFTDGVKTRTSSTVTSGYPMSGYFTGLTSGTKYYCRARALSSDPAYTTSEWSNVTNTRVTSKLPAPIGLAVTDITESSSVLRWDEVENASKGYTVRWRKEGASDWNTDNV